MAITNNCDKCGHAWRHDFIMPTKRAASSNVASLAPGSRVGAITRVSASLKFGACAYASIVTHSRRRSADRCTFPRALGSGSEAHYPVRLGPGGAFLSQSCRKGSARKLKIWDNFAPLCERVLSIQLQIRFCRLNLLRYFRQPKPRCSSTSDLFHKQGNAYAFRFLEVYEIPQSRCGGRWEPVAPWSDIE